MSLSPGEAVSRWFAYLRTAPVEEFTPERWRQAAGALRRMEASEEIRPQLELLAAQCELLAAADQFVDTEIKGA